MTIMSGPRKALGEAARLHWERRLRTELRDNILPFWIRHAVDEVNGGFYGAVTNDLRVLNDVPRTAVLCARILWTYSCAHRTFKDDRYLKMAERAYDDLTHRFWDQQHRGVYWSVDRHGRPVSDRKHAYAQAFTIYGLAEFYRVTQAPESLRLAQELFDLTQAHTYDNANGGNIEGCSRDWSALADMRLSDKEPNCRKSMNTLLHLMEAYTNLARVWDSAALKSALRGLIQVFLEHVVDPRTGHFRQFFDDQWRPLSDDVSFGHDIEGSWLLVEAAEVLGQQEIVDQVRETAVRMAEAVYAEGLDSDGSLLFEPDGKERADKQWWVEAEGVVGFYNAYQLTSRERFAEAALRIWGYVEQKFVDRTHGDWFKLLNRAGVPYADSHKIGPWECPYHHSRCCLEMLARLAA